MAGKSKWQDFESWRDYGTEGEYDQRNANSLRKSENGEERVWYNRGSKMKWAARFDFSRKRDHWQTFEDWGDHGVELGYDERSRKNLQESEDKEERSWYIKGDKQRWLTRFDFSRERTGPISLWPDFDSWQQNGIERGYGGRNAKSLEQSEDKRERKWYNRGTSKRWVRRFDFSRERKDTSLWSTFGAWRDFGIGRKYGERNAKSLEDSKDKEERSWYSRGGNMKWVARFDFSRKADRWSTFEAWRDHGVERGYGERNPASLSSSKDKDERSWYAKGTGGNGWARDFEFLPRGRWPTFDNWRDHGVERGYGERNPNSLHRSEKKEERSWYKSGVYKRWVTRFEFRRLTESNADNGRALEEFLEGYIGGEDAEASKMVYI